METGHGTDPSQMDIPQIETEKPKNNVSELWNSSLRDIVEYTYDSGLNIVQEDNNERKQNPDELEYLVSYMNNILPLRDDEGKTARVLNEDSLKMILADNPELKDMYKNALDYRVKHNLNPDVPIGVAVRMATAGSILNSYNVEEVKQSIRKALADPVKKEEFNYILENYIRPETYPQRYESIAHILEDRNIGINQDSLMLDIGSSSGQALIPLSETRFPKLKIIALDKLPTQVLDYFFPLNKEQGNVERRLGDALKLEIPNNSVDVVTLSYILMHLAEDDCKQALNEAFRVLKVGGVILIQGLKQYNLNGEPGFFGHVYRAQPYGDRDSNEAFSDFDGVVLCKKDENTLEEQLVYGRSNF